MFKRLKKIILAGKACILIAYVAGNRILRLQDFCSKQKKDHQGYLMGSMMAEVMVKT